MLRSYIPMGLRWIFALSCSVIGFRLDLAHKGIQHVEINNFIYSVSRGIYGTGTKIPFEPNQIVNFIVMFFGFTFFAFIFELIIFSSFRKPSIAPYTMFYGIGLIILASASPAPWSVFLLLIAIFLLFVSSVLMPSKPKQPESRG
jgi:hypothetical protein